MLSAYQVVNTYGHIQTLNLQIIFGSKLRASETNKKDEYKPEYWPNGLHTKRPGNIHSVFFINCTYFAPRTTIEPLN